MRTLICFLVCLGAAGAFQAQKPLSQDEALKQVYSQYDAAKHTAHWVCTESQKREPLREGWPCWKEYSTVSVSVLLMAQVPEADTKRVYLVAAAKPVGYPDGYDCHLCAPAIGAGVFAWKGQHWVMENASASVGFYGGWGVPPGIAFAQVGPEKHGILLSLDDMGQGYASSYQVLFLPLDGTAVEVWHIEDEQDNFGSIDPDDKLNKQVPYRSSAAFKFYADLSYEGGSPDYYDIEVISRGNDRQDFGHPIKPENWTEIYRFKDGEYKLLSHKDFVEVKKPAKK